MVSPRNKCARVTVYVELIDTYAPLLPFSPICCFASVCFVLFCFFFFVCVDRLAGLVVKASASTAEDPGFESSFRRDFSEVESYQ